MSSKISVDSLAGQCAPSSAERDEDGEVVRYRDIELDTRTHVVRRGERVLRLNRTSLLLVAFFIGRPEIAHTRSQIAKALWGEHDCDERTVDVYIRRLRRALTRGSEPDPVRTVRGVGYALSYQESGGAGRVRKVSLTHASRGRADRMKSGRRAAALACRSAKPRVDR